MAIHNPKILDYPGAKWRIADWIIQHFPEHKSYLEPYGGSAAVLFRKLPSRIETINDLDGEVVNLFHCIKENPEQLAGMVCGTPYARTEYDNAFQYAENPYEKAKNLLTRSWMGYGYRACEKTGWKRDVNGREYAYAVKHWNGLPECILQAAVRLKQVQVECKPAVELIGSFRRADVLIYADPPYPFTVRSKKQYRHEMTMDEHVELLAVLKEHPGPVVISSYDNELYNQELMGWSKDQIQSNAQGGLKRVETIWVKQAAGR